MARNGKPNGLLNLRDAADQLNVAPRTLQGWLLADLNQHPTEPQARRFPNAFKIGVGKTSPWKVPAADVENWKTARTRPHVADGAAATEVVEIQKTA